MVDILLELVRFVKHRKKYVLIPVFLASVVLGGLIVMAQGSAVAPFIYTLF